MTDPEEPLPTASNPTIAPGSRFGEQYEILEFLGRGGMSAVYKARHCAIDRIVALKVLRADQRLTPVALRRFQQEAKLIERLKHPNIVQAYSIGATGDG